MKIHIITSDAGDWMEVIKDGIRVAGNHSIDGCTMLEALGLPFTRENIDDEDELEDKLNSYLSSKDYVG